MLTVKSDSLKRQPLSAKAKLKERLPTKAAKMSLQVLAMQRNGLI
jgi:hypothetical protein